MKPTIMFLLVVCTLSNISYSQIGVLNVPHEKRFRLRHFSRCNGCAENWQAEPNVPRPDVGLSFVTGTDHCETVQFDLASLPQNIHITKVRLVLNLKLYTANPPEDLATFNLHVSKYDNDYMIDDLFLKTPQQRWEQIPVGKEYESFEWPRSSSFVTVDKEYSGTHAILEDILQASTSQSRLFSLAFWTDYELCREHVITFRTPSSLFVPSDISLFIEYANVIYKNDFKRSHHGYVNQQYNDEDFIITDPSFNSYDKDHNEGNNWAVGDVWDIQMHSHYNIQNDADTEIPLTSIETHSSPDSRHYNRYYRRWSKYDESNTVMAPDGSTWNTSITHSDRRYTMTANFYRLVNNRFKLMNLMPGYSTQDDTPITSGTRLDEFTVDNQSGQHEYVVYQRKNGTEQQHQYEAVVPLTIETDTDTKYFVAWAPDEYVAQKQYYPDGDMRGSTLIDDQVMTATTTIKPDLHHMDSSYANPYTAYYAQITCYAFEKHQDITSEVLALTPNGTFVGTYNGAEDAWPLIVPKEYYDAGTTTTYDFVGWWDGVYGEEIYQNGEVYIKRHLPINKYEAESYRFKTVAMYKAHLKSDDLDPVTNTNSQRKIVVDSDGDYHMVYESASYIWYTQFHSNNGMTWSPEKKVSRWFAGWCHSPSIAVAQNGDQEDIVITYVDENPTYPGVFVVSPEWTGHNENWQDELRCDPTILAQTSYLPANDCIPAVAINTVRDTKTWMAVWNDGNDLRFTMGTDPASPTLVYEDEVLTSGTNPEYPSIAWVSENGLASDDEYAFHIAWKEGGYVKFTDIRVDESGGDPDIPISSWDPGGNGAVNVEIIHDPGSSAGGISAPALGPASLAANDRKLFGSTMPSEFCTYVAYEVQAPSTSIFPVASYAVSPQRIYSRQPAGVYSSSIPSTQKSNQLYVRERLADPKVIGTGTVISDWRANSVVYSFSYPLTQLLAPSVSILDVPFTLFSSTQELARTVFQFNNGGLSRAKTIGNGLWTSGTSIEFHAYGEAPNLPVLTDQNTLMSAYVSETNGFNQGVFNSTYQLLKTSTTQEQVYMRKMVVTQDSAFVSLGICNPRSVSSAGDVEAIDWNTAIDSSGVDWYFPIPLRMRTAAFNADDIDSVLYEWEMFSAYNELFDSGSFEVNFHDAEDDGILLVRSIDFDEFPEDSSYYALTGINTGSLGNRDVYMTFSVSGDVDTSNVEIVQLYGLLEYPDEMPKSIHYHIIPGDITLSNYPNPFNPSTDITYGIPEETHVKLAVYDNLGREVKVLTNGWKAAGTYTVTFDAADLPSGMYLYRIETAKGSVSKKMMLMK